MITIESPTPELSARLSPYHLEYLHSFNGAPIFLDTSRYTSLPLLVGPRPPVTFTYWWIGRDEVTSNYMDFPEDLINHLKSLAVLMNLF